MPHEYGSETSLDFPQLVYRFVLGGGEKCLASVANNQTDYQMVARDHM